MRRAWRWFGRIVLGLLGLALVGVTALLIVLHTDWGRNIVRRRVVAALQSTFPGSTIESISGSVLGTLVVHDLRIVAKDARELVSIGTLELEVSLWPLLGKTARIDSLVARDVHVQARPLPPEEPAPDAEPTAWSIELPAISVHAASVTIEATGDVISDLDLGAAAEIPAGAPIRAAAQVSATWNQRALAGIATITAGAETRAFVALGGGGSSLVASSASLEKRTGLVVARVAAAELARFAPALPLAGEGRVVISLAPSGGGEQPLVASASIGDARIDAVALVDVARRSVRGVAGTSGLALAPLTAGRFVGSGRAVVAGVLAGERARAVLLAGADEGSGGDALSGVRTVAAMVAIDGDLRRANVLALARGAGGDVRVALLGSVARAGDALAIEEARAGVGVADPFLASGGRVPIRGALALDVLARGPTSALALEGRVRGARLRFDRTTAARLAGTFHGVFADAPQGTAHLELAGVANAGSPLGAVTLDVGNRPDGRFLVRARGRSSTAPVRGEIAAVITPGEVIGIALGAHRIELPSGVWQGTGGRVRIEPRAIVVEGIRTTHGPAWATVDARIGRGTGALAANIETHEVPLAVADPRYRGTITSSLELSRARGRWSGEGSIRAAGLQIGEDLVPVDASGRIAVAGHRVTVGLSATNAQLGGVRLGLEVEAPPDLLDVAGWTRVARTDLHAVTIGLDRLDAAVASRGTTAGTLDGTLEIRAGVPSGVLRVRGVPTPAGTADADLTLALTDVGIVDANAQGRISAIGAADVAVRLAIPDHPFDPAAWRALGTRVIQGARAEAKEVVIDPALFTAFGIAAPYRGTAGVSLELGPGAESARLGIELRGVTGGPLVRAIDAHVEAAADKNGTRGALRASTGAQTLLVLDDAATPVTLARWIADARGALTAPLRGTLVIGPVSAPDALAVLGRADVQRGTVSGKIIASGTLGTPTATATFDALDVQVSGRFGTKAPPALRALHLEGVWGGAGGRLRITAEEAGQGRLLVDASGDPRDPASLLALVDAKALDLAPLAAFLPGPLGGAGGVLEADLRLRGADPSLGTLRGRLALRDGQIPFSPTIGTMRRAELALAITDTGVTARLRGLLGAGTVTVSAASDPAGVKTVIDATLDKVSPIGALQPRIDAKVHATMERTGGRWAGRATISGASIDVPSKRGQELLDPVVPADVIFVDLPVLPRIAPIAGVPKAPFLVLDVRLESTHVTVKELAVDAEASGAVKVSVGDGLGLDGRLVVDRGSADVFNHRYEVQGGLVFDGTTDGRLDLKLTHQFPGLVMLVRFAGRLSELGKPELTSEPGVYTEGQLLGFFLGGEPGGDPSRQSREAAVGFGAALASGEIGKRLKRFLPIDLDVLRCEPGTGTVGSSASCTAGKWLTRRTYISYRQRLEGRYDENSIEGALEWHFLPSWQLGLSGGDRNYYGGDLLWRKQW